MSLKAFPISKSVGFVLTKRYCIYDELIAFCCQKRIDFMPECDDHGYYGVFRIHLPQFDLFRNRPVSKLPEFLSHGLSNPFVEF